MSFNIKPVVLSGKEVYPIIEGGKGIAASNGFSAGAFAAAGAVGTFSGVFADFVDELGNLNPFTCNGATRKERHFDLIQKAIRGGIDQAKIAYELAQGKGLVHMNLLWELGGAVHTLEGILEGAKGLINGITCGAGMPYKLAEIAEKFNIFYYPIVSSMRAFRALWKRAYEKRSNLLGAIVYEDPWLAGGHNGLSNAEDPTKPQDPYPRVVEIRKFMNEVGLHNTPIIMAGGVWNLEEWEHWLDNKEIGPIAFQFGTRPLLTEESPIPLSWKRKLLTIRKGDVYLNRFSPTGFYSSAVENNFIKELKERNEREVPFKSYKEGEFTEIYEFGPRARPHYVKPEDKHKINGYIAAGFVEAMKTPDDSFIFVTPQKSQAILQDQQDCIGCLSACRFSNWQDHGEFTTGVKADPRSFCISKTLNNIIHNGDVENELLFSGHNAYRFSEDEFYKDGFIPTVKQLVERILIGK